MRVSILSAAFLCQLFIRFSFAESYDPRVREIFTFQDGTFIENLVVLSNGHIIFTTFDRAHVYDIDPNQLRPEPQLVAQLPNVNAASGIAEIAPDTFAITASNYSGGINFEPGSLKLFTVSLNADGNQNGTPATVKLITNVPEEDFLNGMCRLPTRPHAVLSADSINGRIVFFDTATGLTRIAIADDILKPITGDGRLPLGVNGIHVLGSFLYFTNSARRIFGRIPITDDGNQAGPAEILATEPANVSGYNAYDDFKIIVGSKCGPQAFIATQSNAIIRFGIFDKKLELFLGGGNTTFLHGPGSVASSRDQRKLYIITGGLGGIGGQILEIATP
jgi:hypothetical protein